MDLLPNAVPVQANYGAAATPAAMLPPGEIPTNSHFTLYAIQNDPMGDRLFAVQPFEIHRIIDLSSPCYIDDGDHVPYPGIHVSQYAARIQQDTGIVDVHNPPATATDDQKIEVATALQRMANIALLANDAGASLGIRAVVSSSTTPYPAIAADCSLTDKTQIPPSMCMDDASNALRRQLCEKTWAADPDLFEGSDRVLTEPLNGTNYGLVDGVNPITQSAIGGAQLFVPNALENVDAYAIYVEPDADTTGAPGMQLFYGTPTMPTRGVLHVHLVNPANPALTSEMAIFADLGQDSVHF